MRDITLGDTVDYKFTTTDPDTGAPITLAGTPVVSAYVGNSTTQITAGITLTVDFDGVTGLHNVRVVASSGNGYTTASDVALIITTGTVDGVSAVGYKVGEFSIGRASTANVTQWLGTAAATPTVAGVPEVDVTHWIGTAAATPTVAGVPEVDVTHFGGTAGTFASGVPAVNATQISGDSTAADNLETAFDDTAGAVPWMLISHQGTLQAVGSTTSVTLAATASAEDNVYKGHTFHFVSATTGAKQSALCTAYVGSTKVATLDPALSVALTGTVGYKAAATAPSSGSAGGLDAAGVRAAIGLGSANLDTQLSTIDTVVDSILVDTAEIGAAGAGLTNINLPNQTMDIVGSITGNLSGSVGSVTGAVGSVTGAVGSVAANGISAASLAADAGTEIAAAVLTAATATPIAANMEQINAVPVVGDGAGTPFGV